MLLVSLNVMDTEQQVLGMSLQRTATRFGLPSQRKVTPDSNQGSSGQDSPLTVCDDNDHYDNDSKGVVNSFETVQA